MIGHAVLVPNFKAVDQTQVELHIALNLKIGCVYKIPFPNLVTYIESACIAAIVYLAIYLYTAYM